MTNHLYRNFDQKISVIMPAYNCEKYINEAISSVIDQTYKNLELLIVDDKSSDDTLKIAKQLQQRDERIIVLENPINMGVSYSRNYAINKATGQWLAFLDSDDIWKIDKLEKQIQIINQYSAELVFTGCQYINESGRSLNKEFKVPKIVDYSMMIKQNYISCSSVLGAKSLGIIFDENLAWIHEDYLTWLRVLKKCKIAYSVQEPLLLYRVLENSRSSKRYLTIVKNYRMFRELDYNVFTSILYSFFNSIRSIFKYILINK